MNISRNTEVAKALWTHQIKSPVTIFVADVPDSLGHQKTKLLLLELDWILQPKLAPVLLITPNVIALESAKNLPKYLPAHPIFHLDTVKSFNM